MASELESLIVELGLDASEYAKGLDKAGRDTDDFAKKGNAAWGGFTAGVGIAVTEMATTAVGAIANFGMESLSLASDLGETTSKVNTLFGDSAQELLDWADTADTAFGLSEASALDAVGGLGNMFMQLGAGTDQAGDLSTSMVGLAADLASFHNAAGGTNEVLDTMTAAFRGEYDSVQKFIPTINGANVEMKALEMTGKATAGELTALEKALAVQAILMEDAGAATGDFARTSEGMANQQRIMNAQLENMHTTLGALFIPIVTQAVGVVNQFLPVIADMTGAFVDFLMNGGDIQKFGDLAREAFGSEVASFLTDLAVSLQLVGEAISAGSLEPFKEFVDNVGFSSPVIAGLVDTVLTVGPAIMDMVKPIVEIVDYFVDWQDVLAAVGVVIAMAVVPAIISMIAAALPIIATFAAIVAGIALLRKAWESDFLGLRTNTQAFGTWFSEN